METAVLLHRREYSPARKSVSTINGARRFRRFLMWFTLLTGASLVFLLTKPGIGPYLEPVPSPLKLIHYEEIDKPKQRQQVSTPAENDEAEEMGASDKSSRGFVVSTTGCKIPDLQPLDPAVRKFVKFYALDTENQDDMKDSEGIRPNCSREFGSPLVESNLTSLYIVQSSLLEYNITNADDLHCCYRPFHRLMADPLHYDYSADNKFEYDRDCIKFGADGTVSVGDEEFVKVECRIFSDDPNVPLLYRDFHSFVPKAVGLKRAEVQRRTLTETTAEPRSEKWNVLIVGVDAVSRLNFHRQMPKTQEILRKIGAIEFLGYNKVADNTFPNIVPLMTGLTEQELKNSCWPNPRNKLDDCPWIWYNFTSEGYLTGLGEDCAWMSTFNYVKVGFLSQPSHFYLRPLAKVAEDEIGHLKRMNAKVCIGPRLTVQMVFGYAEKFVKSLSRPPDPSPFFALFWVNSLTHDYLNSAGYADEPQAKLIGEIAASGALERTVFLFISDHGIRWGGIRETYQGRLEERLPFVFVAVPPALKEKYPSAVANLRRNAKKRLTTPFDLHATMMDLLKPEETMTAEAVSRRSREIPSAAPKTNSGQQHLPRGVSLFLPLPEWRTCEVAGVTENWCACHTGEKVIETNDTMAVLAADEVVAKVNEMLNPYPQCAKRTLTDVKSAIVSSPSHALQPKPGKKVLHDVSVVVESNPGSALFEATVRIIPTDDGSHGNATYRTTVAGTISRINRYGNQSVCVDEFHMKLYCYCGS